MSQDEGGFLSRWSRRKAQAREDAASADAAPWAPAVAGPATPDASPTANPAPAATPAQAEPLAKPAEPMPTLDEAAALTPQDDFRRFVARGVPAQVRNAAVKKLFADPHFNVMDGLDIYIDDYTQPSPLAAADMARMVGARFLRMVEEPSPETDAGPVPTRSHEDPQPRAAEEADAAPATSDAPPETVAVRTTPQEPDDDHPDLQLQPDHAPERERAGGGAG